MANLGSRSACTRKRLILCCLGVDARPGCQDDGAALQGEPGQQAPCPHHPPEALCSGSPATPSSLFIPPLRWSTSSRSQRTGRGVSPLREERALLPTSDSRPADILVPHWGPGGKDLAIDVTIVNSVRLDLVSRSAIDPGLGLTTAFNNKWRRYAEACESEGISFCPFVLDSFGAWHERAATEVKRLGLALARASGQPDSQVISHLIQRLSLLVMRGSAILLVNRTPEDLNIDINFL